MKTKALVAALAIGLASVAQAQAAAPAPAAPPAAPAFTFALHGFAIVSVCGQDGQMAPSGCQQSLYATNDSGTDKTSFTADVRQTRLNFSVKGPTVLGGATPQGVVEIDFFNGQGGGNYGNVSLVPRMRLAYGELNWGSNRLAFGQLNDLVIPMIPTSISHIGFPLGYATGSIGWRRPGIFGFHTFGGDTKVEFAWEVGRAQWADTGVGTGVPGNGIGAFTGPGTGGYTLGEASGVPAVEARLSLTSGKTLMAFVSGHWNQVDPNGWGVAGGRQFTVAAGNAGFKLTPGPLTIAATGFTGVNTAPLIGNFLQFQATTGAGPTANVQDVHTWGYWAQVGFNLTKEFSLWALFGQQKPNRTEAEAAGFRYLENTTYNALAQYRDGGFAFTLEWVRFVTVGLPTFPAAVPTTPAGYATLGTNKANIADQYIFSAGYFF